MSQAGILLHVMSQVRIVLHVMSQVGIVLMADLLLDKALEESILFQYNWKGLLLNSDDYPKDYFEHLKTMTGSCRDASSFFLSSLIK